MSSEKPTPSDNEGKTNSPVEDGITADLQATNKLEHEKPSSGVQYTEKDHARTTADIGASAADVPYCILPEGEKIFLMIICSIAGMVSPMSSSVYFPALNNIGNDLNVSTSLMNLTVTTYLVSGKPRCTLGGYV
jgi:hypothetical protein